MPVLVADGQQVVDAKLTVGPSKSNLIHTINVTNMPVERNYRTNVYGSLLSSTQDFNVEKEPNFDGSYSQEVWDGSTGKMPTEVEGVYTITGSDQLAAFAQEVRSGKNFSGKIVKLAADLDLNNFEWTPIGNDSKPFAGTFDGGGYTISNLSITKLNGKEHLGLFGAVKYGTIENLNVENVNIDLVSGFSGYTTADGVSAVAGELWNSSAKNVKVNNVTIKAHRRAGGIAGFAYARISDCEATNINIALTTNQKNATTWDNGDKAGAIVGYNGEGTYTITNNKVSNVTLSGYRHIGGMVGYANSQNTISGNTGSGVLIKANAEHSDSYDEGTQPTGFGLVYGYLNPSGTDSNNNVTGEVFGVNAPVQTVADLKQAIANGGYISIPATVGAIELNETLSISKPATIELAAGSSLVLGNNRIINSSDLVISGKGTITSDDTVIENTNGGTLVINDGTFAATGVKNYNVPVYSEGDVVINGGVFTANAGNAVRINMVNGNSGKVVINGGEFTNHADGGYALSFYGDVEFEVNGGVYSGVFGSGRADNGARGVIRGGTFICEGSYYGFSVDAETYGGPSSVTIEGGEFYSKNASSLYARHAGSLILKGGKFNKKVTTGGAIVLANGFKLNDIDTDLTVNFDGENHTYKFVQAVVAE